MKMTRGKHAASVNNGLRARVSDLEAALAAEQRAHASAQEKLTVALARVGQLEAGLDPRLQEERAHHAAAVQRLEADMREAGEQHARAVAVVADLVDAVLPHMPKDAKFIKRSDIPMLAEVFGERYANWFPSFTREQRRTVARGKAGVDAAFRQSEEVKRQTSPGYRKSLLRSIPE